MSASRILRLLLRIRGCQLILVSLRVFKSLSHYWHISAILSYSLRRRNCLVSCFQFGVCIRLSLLLSDLFSFLYNTVEYNTIAFGLTLARSYLVSFPDVNKNKCPCIHAKSSSLQQPVHAHGQWFYSFDLTPTTTRFLLQIERYQFRRHEFFDHYI